MTYIKNVLHRVTLPGGIFIAAIAVVPTIIFYFTGNTLIQAFGGTSILIMIGVALDTMNKVESQLKMHNYEVSSNRGICRSKSLIKRLISFFLLPLPTPVYKICTNDDYACAERA